MYKITQVISDGNVGGAGILLSHVTEALKGIFDFEILVPEHSALIDRLPRRGVRITPLSFCPDKSFSPSDIAVFARHFQKTRPHAVHSHASLTARLAGRLLGIRPLLSTRHCAGVLGTSAPLSPMRRILYNLCTSVTVATADAAARELWAQGIAPSRTVTLPNGVPPTPRLAHGQRRAHLHALGLSDADTVLGCCARLEEVKGQDLLLRAVAGLLPTFPHLRILFVGDGSRRAYLSALAARLGITHAVRFVGYTDTPAVYQNLFTLNVNTSRGTETSCLATSECMSLGIPTVASDFGGNREMIREGENGLLFRTDDVTSLSSKLADLLKSPLRLSDMRQGAARIYRESYSVERMAQRYKELYFSLMQ